MVVKRRHCAIAICPIMNRKHMHPVTFGSKSVDDVGMT